MERTCSVCGVTKPMGEFQRHDRGRRHVCRDCRRAQHAKWQLSLEGAKLRRFERQRDRSRRRYLEKQKQARREKHKERHELLRTVVTAMYRDGLNQKELARLSGVNPGTLRRITSKGPLEKGITEPVEERVLDFYAKWRREKTRDAID